MKQALVSGLGMYVSFDVYQNIMQWRGAQGRQIYTRGSGRKMGGHAVNCVGYGTAGRYNYWKLLNSWGTNWGDNGYWKMLRGRNVCKIESGAFAYKASVGGGGGSSPRRRTSSPRRRAGYPRRRGGTVPRRRTTRVTCKNHKFRCAPWSYVGYCSSDPTYMRKYCAKSCGFCGALLVESGQAANQSANLSASFEDSRSDADKEKEREDMIKKWFGSKKEMEKVWQQEMLENDGQDAEEDGKEEEEAEIADNEEETEESEPGHSDEDEQGVEESELETDGEDIQDASEAAEGDDAKIQ